MSPVLLIIVLVFSRQNCMTHTQQSQEYVYQVLRKCQIHLLLSLRITILRPQADCRTLRYGGSWAPAVNLRHTLGPRPSSVLHGQRVESHESLDLFPGIFPPRGRIMDSLQLQLIAQLLDRVCITPSLKLLSFLLCGYHNWTMVAHSSPSFVTNTSSAYVGERECATYPAGVKIGTNTCAANIWCCCEIQWMLSSERDAMCAHFC